VHYEKIGTSTMQKMDSKTTIVIKAAALAGLLIGQSVLPAAAAGPSFSCSGNNLLPAEAAICANSTLAALDVALASLYDNVYNRTSGAQRDQLVAAEKAWIARRDACGANVPCITQAYRSRIAQLGG
jgi:uncharacterized protein